MQNIIIIILAVFLIIVAKPNINESFIKLKKPLEASANLEGRITELEKNYSAFNEKLSFITIKDGTVNLNGNFQINGKLFFHNAKKAWIEDGNNQGSNMTPGCSIRLITHNGYDGEQRNVRFHHDGNICRQVSGKGDRCAL
jgi:hypothetical protein